jgi:hypothetical protein
MGRDYCFYRVYLKYEYDNLNDENYIRLDDIVHAYIHFSNDRANHCYEEEEEYTLDSYPLQIKDRDIIRLKNLVLEQGIEFDIKKVIVIELTGCE